METNFVLAIKPETTPGTRLSDAEMSTAIPVYAEGDVLIPDITPTRIEKKPLSAYDGNKVVRIFKAYSEMEFSISTPLPVVVNDFPNSALYQLFHSSGHSVTILYETPGDDQTPIVAYEFKPQTAAPQSLSVDIIGTELTFKGFGAKAKLDMVAVAGDPIELNFNFLAGFTDAENGTFNPPILTPPEVSIIDENDIYGHVKLGADSGSAATSLIEKLSLKMGADVKRRKRFKPTATRLAGFDPMVDLEGDIDTENAYAVSEIFDGNSKYVIMRIKDHEDLSDAGDPTTGKVKWEFEMPKLTPDKMPSLKEVEGLGYLSHTFNANPTSGNDNYVIRYFV